MGGAALISASSAYAIPSSCGGVAGAVEVFSGVCQISFDQTGEGQSFTAPTGITKMGAILVGGGGGAWVNSDNGLEAYGGGGGGVAYVNLDSDSGHDFEISVGAGGPEAETGGASSLLNLATEEFYSAEGGSGADGMGSGDSGDPGSGDGTFGYHGASGGGACGDGSAMDTVDDYQQNVSGGAGCAPSSLGGSDVALFPASGSDPLLGAGGDASIAVTFDTEVLMNAQYAYGNTGAGGSAAGVNVPDAASSTAQPGTDGGVYIRWQTAQPTNPELAETGVDTSSLQSAIGFSMFIAGIAAVGFGVTRTRRTAMRD